LFFLLQCSSLRSHMICFRHLFVDCRLLFTFLLFNTSLNLLRHINPTPRPKSLGSVTTRQDQKATTPNSAALTGTIIQVTYPEEISQYQNQAIPPISAVYENAVGETQGVVAG
jgi:hypothetical protein